MSGRRWLLRARTIRPVTVHNTGIFRAVGPLGKQTTRKVQSAIWTVGALVNDSSRLGMTVDGNSNLLATV